MGIQVLLCKPVFDMEQAFVRVWTQHTQDKNGTSRGIRQPQFAYNLILLLFRRLRRCLRQQSAVVFVRLGDDTQRACGIKRRPVKAKARSGFAVGRFVFFAER